MTGTLKKEERLMLKEKQLMPTLAPTNAMLLKIVRCFQYRKTMGVGFRSAVLILDQTFARKISSVRLIPTMVTEEYIESLKGRHSVHPTTKLRVCSTPSRHAMPPKALPREVRRQTIHVRRAPVASSTRSRMRTPALCGQPRNVTRDKATQPAHQARMLRALRVSATRTPRPMTRRRARRTRRQRALQGHR